MIYEAVLEANIFYPILIFCSLIISYLIYLMTFKYETKRDLPGPSGLPVIGNLHQLPFDLMEFYKKLCGYAFEFPNDPFVTIHLGFRKMILCHRPESLELILNSSKHIDKADGYNYLYPWLGTGLLTSTGNKWRHRRKLITPSFHYSMLRNYMDIFNEQANVFVDILQSKCDNKDKFDIFPKISLCTLDIICEAAMGKNIQAQTNFESEYVKAILRINEIIFKRVRQPWLWPDIIFNILPIGREHNECLRVLHGFTNRVIQERFDVLTEKGFFDSHSDDISSGNSSKKISFLDLLLKSLNSQSMMNFCDVREEVDTFMFEGHDTTASSLAWTVQLLGCNSDVQEKLFDEINNKCSSNYITFDDLNKLEYLNCVIKESLRFYPSVPWFGRKIKESIKLGGYFIPKNSNLVIMTALIHRNERYFSNPEEFIPERFFDENLQQRPVFSYIPFSAGQRNCIGQKFAIMEMKVVLCHLIRNYKIQSLLTCAEVEPCPDIILRPSKGVWVTLSLR